MSLRRFNNYDLAGMPPVLAWNPLAMRCSRVDEGCRNCWHLRMADRLKRNPSIGGMRQIAYEESDVVVDCHYDDFPRSPRIIAVQFMGDLWHPNADPYRQGILRTMRKNSRHVFLLLTKRPERVTEVTEDWDGGMEGIPENCWLGTSVHDQPSAEKRIPELLKAKCEHKWISIEPMQDSLSIRYFLSFMKDRKIQFVACGPETGYGARPCKPIWIGDIAYECSFYGVPFYDKRDPTCEGFTRREWHKEWKEKIGGTK